MPPVNYKMELYYKDEKFCFDISISAISYCHKPTNDDYKKMKFKVVKGLNPSKLLKLISMGFSVCHVFTNNIRKRNSFLYTYCVFIDIDDSGIKMSDFIHKLDLKPTIAYTTSTNGLPGRGYRYRLIYTFNHKITTESYYKSLYHILIQALCLQNTKDNCGSVSNQLMNGNANSSIETFISNYIYNLDHVFFQNGSLEPLYIPPQPPLHNGSKDPIWKNTGATTLIYVLNDTDKREINLLNKSVKQYLRQKQYESKIVLETELKYNDKGYALFPQIYYRLPVRYSWHPMRVNRFRDHEHRRKRLFIDACLIKVIWPSATFGDILYNLVSRRENYYDNSDYVITNQFLVAKATQVMTIGEIGAMNYVNDSEHGKFRVDYLYCFEHRLTRKGYAVTVRKEINQEDIAKWYDEKESISDNLKWAIVNGIKICRSTLQRYCRDRGINPNPKKLEIVTWYDENLSVNDNLKKAKEEGIKISRSKLYAYCRKNGISTKGNDGHIDGKE